MSDRPTPRSRAAADKPSGDAFLRFCQGINILRSDGTVNRGEARAWINREYPNAELVLAETIVRVLPPPEGEVPDEEQGEPTGIITPPPEPALPGGEAPTSPEEQTA